MNNEDKVREKLKSELNKQAKYKMQEIYLSGISHFVFIEPQKTDLQILVAGADSKSNDCYAIVTDVTKKGFTTQIIKDSGRKTILPRLFCVYAPQFREKK